MEYTNSPAEVEGKRKSVISLGETVLAILNKAMQEAVNAPADIPKDVVTEAVCQFKATMTAITALVNAARDIDNALYLEYLGTIITELSGGPERITDAVQRFLLQQQLEKSGVLDALKKGIIQRRQGEDTDRNEGECNCPICQAERSLARVTGRPSGSAAASGKRKLDS